MEKRKTYFKKMSESAETPVYGSEYAAGADLRSVEDVWIAPGETVLVGTGIAVELRPATVGLLFPRSGMSLKTKLRLANSVGVIDEDYRGEIKAAFTNIGTETERISKGDRIAQLVMIPYVRADWIEKTTLDETERGEGGFGSTGMK